MRSYVRQPAAEILRAERPKIKSKSLRLTTSKWFEKLSFSSRWNLRDIIRNKARTVTGVIGVIGCMTLLVCGFSIKDTMDNYIKTELNIINNYKYRLNITNEADKKKITELMDRFSKDSSKTIAIEIKKDDKIKVNSILVNDAGEKLQTLNTDWKPMRLPEDGVVITKKLAENEGYKIGDEITWHMMGEKEYYSTKIVGINRNPQNQNITMSRKSYESIGREYVPDSIYLNELPENTFKNTVEGVSSVQSIDAIRDSMDIMLKTMNKMINLLVIFAVLLGVIIIYNMGILSFIEKDYQFATLKVLGFSDWKISRLFIQQNIWITVIAILLGLPAGYAVTDFIFKNAIEENYDFGVFVTISTCTISIFGTFLVSLAVSVWLTKRIGKIDMVKSLKANE